MNYLYYNNIIWYCMDRAACVFVFSALIVLLFAVSQYIDAANAALGERGIVLSPSGWRPRNEEESGWRHPLHPLLTISFKISLVPSVKAK